MYLCSVSVIYGFNLGVQYETDDKDKYLVVNLGMFQLIFNW
jgi:hypothetical protein